MIRHIVACDSKHGIAKDGVQPWKLPTDEAYFSKLTKAQGGVVLMGSTTFRVIGHPLPNRQNFVLTRQTDAISGVTLVHDVDEFLRNLEGDVWVIGGAQVYTATLAQADELYITTIDADFDCDTFYPDFDDAFELASETPPQVENGLTYRFCIYKPKNPA